MSIRLSLFVVVPLALALSACPTKSDPLSCLDGCSHQDELTFCDIDGVFPASELANECISPPPDACNRVEPCLGADKTMCTDDSMGVCVECMTGRDCDTGEICDDVGACVAFTCDFGNAGNAACSAVDSSLPYCGDGDVCVGCLDSMNCSVAVGEICDDTAQQCRGCEANPECPSKLCGIGDGVCADAADLLYVADGGSGADCTQLDPCGSITDAIGKVTVALDTIIVGPGTYDDHVSVTTKTVTIVADGDVTVNPALTAVSGEQNVLAVTGTGNVTADGIKIVPASGTVGTDAIDCDAGGTLTLLRSEVSNSVDVGVLADNCTLTITGSTISENSGIGVNSTNGSLTITGSTISGNGGGITSTNSDYQIENNFSVQNSSSAVGGIAISGDGTNLTKIVNFNTFVENTRTDPGYAIACTASSLVATNNIFLHVDNGTNTAFVSGSTCTTTYSLFDLDVVLPAGVGNVKDDAIFVNLAGGDFHLETGSPGINAADPDATLATDIDGDMRPLGGRHDMGADEAE